MPEMDGEATAREIRKIVGRKLSLLLSAPTIGHRLKVRQKKSALMASSLNLSLALPSTTGSPTQALKNIKDEIKKSSFKIIRRRDGFF